MTFPMFINTVGNRRQHDTYLDNLTQLKQAFFTWQAAEASKPTPPAAEVKSTAKKRKKSAKLTSKKKPAKRDGDGEDREINYETFMAWAKEHCGTLSSIKAKSLPTVRTNCRIANNLTMESIAWMISIVAAAGSKVTHEELCL